jgi:uncharacterized membrane protein
MPGKLSLVLIVSVALNAALLGVVGGRMLGSNKAPTPAPMQLERYGPTSDVVARAWEQLPGEDRAELRKQLRERWVSLEGERKRLQEAGRAVYEAALAEPFDEAKLRDAVTIFQQREHRMQQSAEDILIGHLGRMPPEARATAAVGLLTPFNARVQRVDEEGERARPKPPVAALEPAPSATTPLSNNR